MKKFLALLLALSMVLALAACGDKPNDTAEDPDSPNTPDAEDVQPEEKITDSPLEALTKIWEAMPEDKTPTAFGGDYHEENQVENAPGWHSTETEEDAASLDTNFGLPADMVSKVGKVACIRHMLNANTFSCAAYEVPEANGTDAMQEVATGIRDGLMNRAYMCGWPEQLEVIGVGRNVIGFYGALDIVNAFKDALTSVYGDSAVIYYEEDMSEASGDNTFAFPIPE